MRAVRAFSCLYPRGPSPRAFRLFRTRLRSRLRPADDAGFGLIEVMVAMGVVFTTLILLAHTMTVSLSDIGLARQRQGANGLANKTVELARGLPHETLRKGLLTSDLAGDPNVASCAGIYKFRDCSGEVIVHTTGLPAQDPLVPNRTSKTPPQSDTTYNIATYVTSPGGDPATGPLRVIAMASWDQNFRAGADDFVEVETIVYAPKGCVDFATHPISAPCRAFFYGTSSAAKGGIRITGTINGTPVSVKLDTVSARADSQLEQVQHIQGATSSTGLAVGSESVGNVSRSSSADDDSGTPTLTYDTKSFATGAAGTLQAVVGPLSTEASQTAGDVGETTSASAAGQPAPGGGTQVCPTTTPPGPQTDGAACGHSWARQQGTMAAMEGLEGLGALGVMTLASLGEAPENTRVHIDRDPTATDGTTTVTGVRSLGELRLAGLPGGAIPPSGWLGYWVRVTPSRDTVTAVVGDNTTAPTAAVTSGTVEVWNGLGYSTFGLGGGLDLTVPSVDLLDQPLGGNLLDVSISGSVRTGSVSTQDPDGPGSGTVRTKASATATSPIIADISYNIVVTDLLGGELLNAALTISVDLGSLSAQGDYREDALD